MITIYWTNGIFGKTLILSETTTIYDLRRLLATENRLPLNVTRLVLFTQQKFFLQTSDFAIVSPGMYFVSAVEQLLVMFGDLEPHLVRCFEKLLGFSFPYGTKIERESCYQLKGNTFRIVRVTIISPHLIDLHDAVVSIVAQARTTKILFLCHSVDTGGLLMGNGIVPMSAFFNINPIGALYNVFFDMQTCFAANSVYIRVLAEGRSPSLTEAIGKLGGVGQRIKAFDAILSFKDALQEFGWECRMDVLADLEDFDFYLDKWKWPHTSQIDPRTKKTVRVIEQFGETFHIAVLVALYPDLLGKFRKPVEGVTPALHDEVMNFEQYQYLELVQQFSYSAPCPDLITNELKQYISGQTQYSHSDGSALVRKISENGGYVFNDTFKKVQKRLLVGFKSTVQINQQQHVLLVVRISTAGQDTNSDVRDTPEDFIIQFLRTFHHVVIVGNCPSAKVLKMFENRADIIYETEVWRKEGASKENKFHYQMKYYTDLRRRYKIISGVGLWSGSLDMFALLGFRMLRVYVNVSCVSRIEIWSAALGVYFNSMPYNAGYAALFVELRQMLQE